MANIKYFYGDQELSSIHPMRNEEFMAKFPGAKGFRYDGYSKFVGYLPGLIVAPVERMITYKRNPSLHECNAKCMGGRPNGTCECRCGGKNHGAGNSLFGKPMASVLKVQA